MRTVIPAVIASILASLACQARADEDSPRAAGKLTVHEWGVQVRSLAKVKGLIGRGVLVEKGDPKPVLGPPVELIDELPSFVVRHSKVYNAQPQYRAWNKPVMHLYGRAGLNVEVEVRTPLGNPTAYWPRQTPP